MSALRVTELLGDGIGPELEASVAAVVRLSARFPTAASATIAAAMTGPTAFNPSASRWSGIRPSRPAAIQAFILVMQLCVG